jgi:hypothetical protein
MKEINIQPFALTALSSWLAENHWSATRTKAGTGVLWARSGVEVLVPSSADHPDAALRLRVALEAVADAQQMKVEDLLGALVLGATDVVEWRIVDREIADDGISLLAADRLLAAVRQAVVVSGASVQHRRGYFGRRVSRRARALADGIRVAQTRRGSFVLPIVSPVPPAPTVSSTLHSFEVERQPFPRQALTTLFGALQATSQLLDQVSSPDVRQANDLVAHGVSYELSVAIASVLELESLGRLDVSFRWASNLTSVVPDRTFNLDPRHAGFYRALAGNLFESSTVGEQRLIVRVKGLSRHNEPERDGGVAQFRREIVGVGPSLIRAELTEDMYQTASTADRNHEYVAVVGRLMEEEGHRTRLEDVTSVERMVHEPLSE